MHIKNDSFFVSCIYVYPVRFSQKKFKIFAVFSIVSAAFSPGPGHSLGHG